MQGEGERAGTLALDCHSPTTKNRKIAVFTIPVASAWRGGNSPTKPPNDALGFKDNLLVHPLDTTAVTAATEEHLLSAGKAATIAHDNEMPGPLQLERGAKQCDNWNLICDRMVRAADMMPRDLHAITASSAESATTNSHHQRLPGRRWRKRRASDPGVVSQTVARRQPGTSSSTRRSGPKPSGDRRLYRTAAACRSQSRPCGLRRSMDTLARSDTAD